MITVQSILMIWANGVRYICLKMKDFYMGTVSHSYFIFMRGQLVSQKSLNL
jgi:hypothetical protein